MLYTQLETKDIMTTLAKAASLCLSQMTKNMSFSSYLLICYFRTF